MYSHQGLDAGRLSRKSKVYTFESPVSIKPFELLTYQLEEETKLRRPGTFLHLSQPWLHLRRQMQQLHDTRTRQEVGTIGGS